MTYLNLKKKLKQVLCWGGVRDLHGFEYTVNELVNMHKQNKLLTQAWGSIIDQSILDYKKSDTIFLLGSGPSINNLTPQNFSDIKKHDSIGFNFWFAHEFVPNFYMMQVLKEKPSPMLDLFCDRIDDYGKVSFIIRGSALAKGMFDLDDKRLIKLKEKTVYFLNEYPIAGRCRIEIDTLIDYMHALGFLEHGRIGDFVPKWRGTLGLLVSLAYQMGYKNIVLCGMDMRDSNHFWDHPHYELLRKKYGLPVSNNLNLMTDDTFSPNTVPSYMYKLNKWMQDKSGVNLFVADPDTVLHPEIPVYEFG